MKSIENNGYKLYYPTKFHLITKKPLDEPKKDGLYYYYEPADNKLSVSTVREKVKTMFNQCITEAAKYEKIIE